MIKRTKAVLSVVVMLALVVSFAGQLIKGAEASSLNGSFMVMDDMTGGQTTGLVLTVAINPSVGTTPTNITIEFPDTEDTSWCKTAGTVTAVGVATAAANNAGADDITAALPGTLVGACTQGAAGTGDKITITGITALTGSTVYGVTLSQGTAVLGSAAAGSHLVTVSINTGVVVDSLTYGVSTVADGTVAVSATVAASPTVTCSLSSTSVNLGTIYQGGAYATGSHTISASTSATAGGYWWAAYGEGDGSTDAGLWKSTATTDLLASTGSGFMDLRAGEGFGITVSAATGATVAADFVDTTIGQFGALDRAYAGAQLVTYQHSANTVADVPTVTYGGRAGAAAQAGSYAETVTWVCGGYY